MNVQDSTGWKGWIAILGPGLLMAGAAIGVSHLVQATRAGADFGWQLLWLVIAAHLIKLPFFEFGHRYALATGQNLLQGYQSLGRGWLLLFLLLNIVSAVAATAGVTFVTAAIAEIIFGSFWGARGWSISIAVVCVAIVTIGHYRWLDHFIKLLMAVLFVSTVLAFLTAAWKGVPLAVAEGVPSPWDRAAMGFLIALIGWMPAPIEMSVWQSLWLQAKERSLGRKLSMHQGRVDFYLGYGMTLLLAVLFLGLGAMVMFGEGRQFPAGGAAFAAELVGMYGRVIGSWAVPLVAAAAFATMFSTTLTVIDVYPRSLSVGLFTFLGKREKGQRLAHLLAVFLVTTAAILVIDQYRQSLTGLIDIATAIAFVTAPLFAALNLVLVSSSLMPEQYRPGTALRVYCWTGITLLGAFALFYIASRCGLA